MANPWFRVYSEFEDDPKIQMLSEAIQRRFVMLMCGRCKDAKMTDLQRCFKWRISSTELAETKACFVEQGFIDEDWNLINWNRRQFISDSSTDRVRKYRESKKQDETLHETDETKRNVTVTAPDTDTESDTEQKQKKKPSRDKREVDVRHSPFLEAFRKYYQHKTGSEAPWGPREAKSLAAFLEQNPSWMIEKWKHMLNNRGRSEVAHGEILSKWIADAPAFFGSALDRYKQPITGGSNGNGTNGRHATKAERSNASTAAVIRQFDQQAGVHGGDGDDYRGRTIEAGGAYGPGTQGLLGGAVSQDDF